MPQIISDLQSTTALGDWRQSGLNRGGRKLAATIVDEVMHA